MRLLLNSDEGMVKLYLLFWGNWGYDKYSHAVVVANSEDEACTIHPNGRFWDDWDDWDDEYNTWCKRPEDITTVTYVGEAASNLNLGDVVCASFHAG